MRVAAAHERAKAASVQLVDKDHKLLVTTCDKYFRELRADGMRAESQRSEPLTGEEDYIILQDSALSGRFPP